MRFAWLVTLLGATAVAADPLFDSVETLRIRISGPLRTLGADRDADPEYRPATLSYLDAAGAVDAAGAFDAAGAEHTFEIGLRPRGHSRRDRSVCTMPPLWVNLRRKDVDGTLFDGQDKLKLVTHCRASHRQDRYTYEEFLAYRLLNRITQASFRVRPLEIEWVDTDRHDRREQRFGFFVEHKKRLAKRLGLSVADAGRIDAARLEPDHTTLMELFQFMIANTDFSFIAPPDDGECCHNASLLADAEDRYLPIPYDFDMSGFVDAPYSVVDYQLPISNVRQRLYRGHCRNDDVNTRALARFREARDAITETLRTETALADRDRKAAIAFIDGFYEIIDDPRQLARKVLDACRG